MNRRLAAALLTSALPIPLLVATAGSASAATCGAVGTFHQTAPAVGGSTVVQASPAGSYSVSRPATTTLTVTGITNATGWSGTASIPTGTRVRVSFKSATSTDVYRFTTKLNATGTSVITHVVHCV